jgi:diguanylate cyclase (GGDEF)-like protein
MLTSPTQDHAGAVDPAPFGAARPGARGRARAVRFAIVAGVLPVFAAAATQLSSPRALFFAGAAGGCAALVIVGALTRRRRPVVLLAELGGIVAFTLMQAHTGGVASSYALLVLIAMMWLGLQATDAELVVGIALLAACVFGPMLAIGAPAYPVDWGHAAVLFLAGTGVAVTLRVVSREVQRLTRKLRQDALIDDLTGLLNRRGWRYTATPEFERAARTGKPVALVTIDLDRFKELNDELGHDHGDGVLRGTAERMQATFRAGDILARLGGDEFVVLLSNSTLDGALAAARRLREITPAQADLSAGIAMWDGSEDLGELMHRSDRALYAAKSSGGGQTHIAVRSRREHAATEAS